MNMQIKNNFIASDENVMKHYWFSTGVSLSFEVIHHDPNGALWLAYNVMNY